MHLHARALFIRSTSRDHRYGDHRYGDHQQHCDHLLRTGGCGSSRLRYLVIGVAAVAAVGMTACGGLWWRLGSGPIAFDMVTPWLISALEDKFGHGHRVEVGGTVVERDEEGRTAIRLRDVVVRDAQGGVVASAPKADVGIAAASLFTGHVRAERLSLIGAEMALRIERDGQISIFAGAAGERPLASIAAATPIGSMPGQASGYTTASETAGNGNGAPLAETSFFAAAAGWLQSLEGAGLDGRDLTEIGLRNGSISVDDRRTGKRITFDNINLSMTRLKQGGVALGVNSAGADGPWSLNATVTPISDGFRRIEAVIRDVSPKDILLALRLGGENFSADVPLSAVIHGEIGPDGVPRALTGRIVGGAGRIGDARDKAAGVLIDEVQAELRWDPANRTLQVPFEIHAGASRLSLMGMVSPPAERGGRWAISIPQGMVLLASADRPKDPPLMLDRIGVRAYFDPASKRLEVEQLELRGVGAGVAGSAGIDFGGSEPQLRVGIAATSMNTMAFKRLWPAVVSPPLREWIERSVLSGNVERVDISTNMPLAAMLPESPPLPEGAVWIEIKAKGTTIQPVEALPAVRDVDITARVTGRSATVTFGRGTLELASGRKLTISGGTFEVPDVSLPTPPSRARLRVEGGLDAVAEMLALEPLREAGAMPFDAASTRGAVAAQVAIAFPLQRGVGRASVNYAVDAEVSGFSAERFFRGQKGEANLLQIKASQELLQIKGDMRIGGMPAAVDYRMPRGASDAEVRMQATLDDGGRSRLGLDLGGALTGPVPVKLNGRMKVGDREGRETRMAVEADLTQARLSEILPGWSKPPGRAARASFVMVDKGQTIRLEDFKLEGGGAAIRGNLEMDSDGELITADLPSFAVSDGDKASLKAERGADGALRLTLRGDLYDGRGLVKSSVSGQKPDQRAARASDLDLDIKVGAMTGYHGEALRSLELRLSRRNGTIRSFSMSGKLGRDAKISGDLRGRGTGGRMVMYLEAADAGALFRFTDVYPRIVGGTASIAMDPPVLDNTPRDGLLNVKDFHVRGERVLDSVAAGGVDPNDRNAARSVQTGNGVFFSRLRAEFTRSPGKFAIREGVVWGPNIGATVEGHLDYGRDEARLRGTFVPAYALNNLFSRVPVLGFFLGGGDNEGLLGVTYQVVGTPTNPILQVNPMSAVAPGFLRKLFEFRGGNSADERTGRLPDTVR
jgi:hypothetical protein